MPCRNNGLKFVAQRKAESIAAAGGTYEWLKLKEMRGERGFVRRLHLDAVVIFELKNSSVR